MMPGVGTDLLLLNATTKYDAQRVPTLEYRREVNAPVVLCHTHMFRRATCYFCVDAGIQTQDSVRL